MRKTMETIQQKTGRIYHPPCLMKTLRNCEVILILRNHQLVLEPRFRCFLYKFLRNHQLPPRDVCPPGDVSYINFYAITNHYRLSCLHGWMFLI